MLSRSMDAPGVEAGCHPEDRVEDRVTENGLVEVHDDLEVDPELDRWVRRLTDTCGACGVRSVVAGVCSTCGARKITESSSIPFGVLATEGELAAHRTYVPLLRSLFTEETSDRALDCPWLRPVFGAPDSRPPPERRSWAGAEWSASGVSLSRWWAGSSSQRGERARCPRRPPTFAQVALSLQGALPLSAAIRGPDGSADAGDAGARQLREAPDGMRLVVGVHTAERWAAVAGARVGVGAGAVVCDGRAGLGAGLRLGVAATRERRRGDQHDDAPPHRPSVALPAPEGA